MSEVVKICRVHGKLTREQVNPERQTSKIFSLQKMFKEGA